MEGWGSFCCYCGKTITGFFPRICVNGHVTYLNSLIVAVVLQPVKRNSGTYLLAVQRGIEPHADGYALPGGFAENGETIRQAALRELKEETGLNHALHEVKETFCQVTTSSGQDPRSILLQFEVMPDMFCTDIDFNFTAPETKSLCLVGYCEKDDTLKDEDGHPLNLCFPLHDSTARYYLKRIKSVEII